MKTKNKENLLYITLTIIVSLLIILTISIYNSTNYLKEEISTIEYIRTLYYNNFNLIPDFATNLKNGISTYSLILEEYTKLSLREITPIDEEIELEMYNYIRNKLKKKKYTHYEVSNFALNNIFCDSSLNFENILISS